MLWNVSCSMGKNNLNNALAASLLAGTLLVAGCASKPTVQSSRVFYVPEYYTVKSGDSLSKIAAKYGLNYMDVARLNNIDSIDKIYVNQRLRLRGSDKSSSRLVRTTAIPQAGEIKQQSITAQAQTAAVPQQVQAVTPKTTGSVTTAPVGLATTTVPTLPSSQIRWVSPSSAPITAEFNPAQNRKGIIFSGKTGDPIYAAADGEVVYADDGLKEYGQLILLRHTDGYITAYAHNNKLLVSVGNKVKAGQKIAEMGSTGASKTMLEFQIRLNGQPINPTSVFLPK